MIKAYKAAFKASLKNHGKFLHTEQNIERAYCNHNNDTY